MFSDNITKFYIDQHTFFDWIILNLHVYGFLLCFWLLFGCSSQRWQTSIVGADFLLKTEINPPEAECRLFTQPHLNRTQPPEAWQSKAWHPAGIMVDGARSYGRAPPPQTPLPAEKAAPGSVWGWENRQNKSLNLVLYISIYIYFLYCMMVEFTILKWNTI